MNFQVVYFKEKLFEYPSLRDDITHKTIFEASILDLGPQPKSNIIIRLSLCSVSFAEGLFHVLGTVGWVVG